MVLSTQSNGDLVDIKHLCQRQMVRPFYLSASEDMASRRLCLVSNGFREMGPATGVFFMQLGTSAEHLQDKTLTFSVVSVSPVA